MELVGSFFAKLHLHSKQFSFSEGLSREHICWREFQRWLDKDSYKPEIMTQKDYTLCVATAKKLSERIDEFIVDADYGLIHQDLHTMNFVLCNNKIAAIDFDDCIYAPFLYDMTAPLWYINRREDYESLKEGFLKGYQQIRPLPLHHESGLELFMAIRSHYLIDWILSWPNLTIKSFGPSLLAKSLKQLENYNAIK